MQIWDKLEMRMRPKVRYWLPAAAMDESDLREEVRDIAARGFGGIEIVVLASTPPQIACSEDGWGTKNWDHMVDVIADESSKLGMSIDIAIGPGWPIASPAIKSADDAGALCELVYGAQTVPGGTHFDGPLPERRIKREEGTPKLVAAFAYKKATSGSAAKIETGNKVLVQDSYIDLLPYVHGDHLRFDFPGSPEECYELFAFYAQPAVHKINAGQSYVIDHLSKAGVQAVEAYWEEVFKDHRYDSMESFFCDSLEYAVALDWTPDFPEEFERRRGYSILPYLPLIGIKPTYPEPDLPGYRFEDEAVSERIRRDYLETVTQCYCENHLAGLEEMAEKYGKTVRYQVAYNKPFEAERSALYVAVPENEALGRPAFDYMKTMAAAAHLDRKDRYSFECAAQFGHSYGQCYEDLMWWVKRAAIAGMNAQVLHGACYGGKYEGSQSVDGQIPGVEWPGFEGFGKYVSNYWNRTPDPADARSVMDAITRMNTIFRKKAKVDVAVLRDSYINPGEASEFALYDDDGALANHGYTYEFISEELLKHPNAKVCGHVLDPEGAGYKCLVIPQMQAVSLGLLERVEKLAEQGLPVIWVGERPAGAKFYAEADTPAKAALWEAAMERAWNLETIYKVEQKNQVPEALEQLDILPEVILDGSADIITLTRHDEESGAAYYGIYRYNRIIHQPEDPNPDEASVSAIYRKGTTKGSYQRPGRGSRRVTTLKLKGEGAVKLLDPYSGRERELSFFPDGAGYMVGAVPMEEDEMLILSVTPQRDSWPVRFTSLALYPFGPDTEGETAFIRSGFKDCLMRIDLTGRELLPWHKINPALGHLAGKGIYEGSFQIDEVEEGRRYELELGDVGDTFTVQVNGQDCPFPDQVMKRVDVTGLLCQGENSLTVTVTSNLYNRLFYPGITTFGIPLAYVPRSYGIWESEGKKIALRKIL